MLNFATAEFAALNDLSKFLSPGNKLSSQLGRPGKILNKNSSHLDTIGNNISLLLHFNWGKVA